MKFTTNTVSEVYRVAMEELCRYYDENESRAMLNQLFLHYYNRSRVALVLEPDYLLTEGDIVRLVKAITRLKKFEPLQYILGSAHFCGLDFRVKPGVLIPRPESEELVELILKRWKHKSGLSVLDLCSGSGCIAIALEKGLPNSRVMGIEISEEALAVSRQNALLLERKVEFLQRDLLAEPLPEIQFHIIVSNPPYVRQSERQEMLHNVLHYEPDLALFVSDSDPLIFYRRIASDAFEQLYRGGELWFEINEAFGEAVKQLLLQNGFSDVDLITDFRGRHRFVVGIKK